MVSATHSVHVKNKTKQSNNNDNINNNKKQRQQQNKKQAAPLVNARERCLTLHQPTAAGAPLRRPGWQTGAHRQSDWLSDCIAPLSRHTGPLLNVCFRPPQERTKKRILCTEATPHWKVKAGCSLHRRRVCVFLTSLSQREAEESNFQGAGDSANWVKAGCFRLTAASS